MRTRILAALIQVKALNLFDFGRVPVKISDMKPNKVRLFIKPFCGWCHEAIDWLEDRGIPFETLDVTSDRAARNEMFELTGQTLAPVIEVDGEVLADFDTDQLEVFWKKLESSPA
jgi:glutaredoxin 3